MTPLAEASKRALETVQVARKTAFLAPMHARLYRSAALHFERQQDALRRELERRGLALNETVCREGLADDLDEIIGGIFAEFRPLFAGAMARTLGETMKGAVRHRLADVAVDLSFNLDHPLAQEHLLTYSMDAVAGIDETTRRSLRQIVARGEREGTSYTEIARQMVRQFDRFGEVQPQRHIANRAELIAVHELGNAYEAASRQTVDAIEAKGLPMVKYWSNTGDDRVSDQCRADTAAGWIRAGDPFPSGRQHAPGHPACRCSILYELDEQAAQAGVDPRS